MTGKVSAPPHALRRGVGVRVAVGHVVCASILIVLAAAIPMGPVAAAHSASPVERGYTLCAASPFTGTQLGRILSAVHTRLQLAQEYGKHAWEVVQFGVYNEQGYEQFAQKTLSHGVDQGVGLYGYNNGDRHVRCDGRPWPSGENSVFAVGYTSTCEIKTVYPVEMDYYEKDAAKNGVKNPYTNGVPADPCSIY